MNSRSPSRCPRFSAFLRLALILAIGLPGYVTRVNAVPPGITSAFPTNQEQNLETLWDQTFPGNKLEDINQWARFWGTEFWTPFWVSNFQSLPREKCNKIAVAAARELSLNTKNGDPITAAVIEKLGHQFPAKDTPEEASFRRLEEGNTLRIQLLSGMAQLGLISDSRVIGPLVEMLDYPGNSFVCTIYTDGSGRGPAGVLFKLTGCEYYKYEANSFEQYETGQKHAEFVKGWRDWLARNKGKRLIFDPILEEIVKDRIATIKLQLREDMGPIPPLYHLGPESIGRMPVEPTTLFEEGADTHILQQFFATNYCLGIRAEIENPPMPSRMPILPQLEESGQYPASSKKQLLHEVLPGTDILITVVAASQSGLFMKQLRDSLAKLPPPIDSAEAAERQWETVRATAVAALTEQLRQPVNSFQAAQTLVQLQSETPVINALTNENQIIRQAALYALANPAVTEAAVGPLVSLLKTNNPDCLSAMTALAQIRKGTNVVVPALLPLLQAKNSSVRQYALETLCAYKVPAKILLPTFMDLLSDTNPAVRHAVIEEGVNWVLENEECDTVVPALIRMLNDPDPDVRSSVVDDLGHAINEKLYGGTHPYLLEHLQARPLGDFAPQANMIVPAIINSLSDTNAEVRDAAARALADIGPFEKAADAKIVAALIPALRDENKNVSAAAASALENFGAESKDALPVLAGLTNSDLAWNANDAMSRIRADDYRLQLDDILRKKFPRLDWVAAPIKKTAATHWSVETNRAPGISTSPILFKRATFKMTAMGNHPMAPASIDFVTFKTPAGKIWMGWDMDFYVETDTGIIGGILAPYGTVYWHDDLARPMDGDLDDVISRFMQRVDNGKIKGESNRETSLSGASNYFFEIPGTAQGVMPKFLGLTVEGKEVQLDLENPQTGRKASFWIDLGTWKVIKAI